MDNNSDITVILNVYRRPQNLPTQIKAVREQSVPPKEIWLYINFHEDQEPYDFDGLLNAKEPHKIDKIIYSSYNFKYYGRFAIALLVQTKYVALYDDDTIPGKDWHKNCLDTMEINPGILGSAGIILNSSTYEDHVRVGWPSQNEDIVRCDLVGHAWFTQRANVKYIWYEKPPTYENAEDAWWSYCAQKYGQIKTYCPPHPKDNKDMWGSIYAEQLGIDDVASSQTWNHHIFFPQRDAVIKAALEGGWQTTKQLTQMYW